MAKSALALKKADDLFEKSSMSFGDHLEELRRALFKSSVWLAVGLAIGLPLATTVVNYMQVPLRKSLDKYYDKKSKAEMTQSSGKEVSTELSKWLIGEKKVTEVVFRDMRRLKAA